MGASADLSLCTLLVRSHLRIDVVCRGPVLYHSGVTPDTPDNGTRRLLRHGFRLGDFDVRPLSGEVSGPDGITTLRPEVMEVLLNLAAAKGDVVDEDQLAHAVWGSKGQSRARLEQCIRELQDCLNSGIESLPHVRRAILPLPMPFAIGWQRLGSFLRMGRMERVGGAASFFITDLLDQPC